MLVIIKIRTLLGALWLVLFWFSLVFVINLKTGFFKTSINVWCIHTIFETHFTEKCLFMSVKIILKHNAWYLPRYHCKKKKKVLSAQSRTHPFFLFFPNHLHTVLTQKSHWTLPGLATLQAKCRARQQKLYWGPYLAPFKKLLYIFRPISICNVFY